MPEKYTYLIINILAVSIPLSQSFERRVYFFRYWKSLFPAIFITGTFFIAWDIIFTRLGVWGFNPRYLLGVEIVNLPLGEWLFFISIPYACVFTYEALNYYLERDYLGPYAWNITIALVLLLVVISVINTDRYYTFYTGLMLSIFLLLHLLVFKADYLGRFYLSYLVIMIPFFIVNGLLTGSWIDEQIVWYDNSENLGIRMFTIPVEDAFYGMFLILMNITIYEKLNRLYKLKGCSNEIEQPFNNQFEL